MWKKNRSLISCFKILKNKQRRGNYSFEWKHTEVHPRTCESQPSCIINTDNMKILLSKFNLFYHSLSQATEFQQELTESVSLFLKCSTYIDENQWNLRFWREINIQRKPNIHSTDLQICRLPVSWASMQS